ncbi:hypothetical protein Val02_78420 [Virgisporangium aliadipatigenens]|uniref:Uncharacterized protein n=1 Tax=Virgisporangium aliadipatigenens TaxID=741659 RepID=A0A8J3YSZ7_9ACTN|nr:hypothetical protein Val02_78420 [Virgisporangium aliadipatigenens]
MRRHYGLLIVVGVKGVPVGRESFEQDLNVLPSAVGHLIADELRFYGQIGLVPDRAALLAQFVPDLLALSGPVAVEPSR